MPTRSCFDLDQFVKDHKSNSTPVAHFGHIAIQFAAVSMKLAILVATLIYFHPGGGNAWTAADSRVP